MGRLHLSLVGALIAAALSTTCSPEPSLPVAKTMVRIATSTRGGGFLTLARALEPELKARLVRTEVQLEVSAGAVDNLRSVAQHAVECGFTYADVAYDAFIGGQLRNMGSLADVRALAVLQVTPVQLVASKDSGISGLSDLRGKRVALGGPGSATSIVSRRLLAAHGIDERALRVVSIRLEEVPQAMAAQTLDAVFDTAVYSEAVAAALEGGARLVPIAGEPVDRLREQYPFLHTLLVPPRTYALQTLPILSVGMETLLVCRRELAEPVAYELTRALVEGLQTLSRSNPFSSPTFEQLPATAIPLHAGAAIYYREMELLR